MGNFFVGHFLRGQGQAIQALSTPLRRDRFMEKQPVFVEQQETAKNFGDLEERLRRRMPSSLFEYDPRGGVYEGGRHDQRPKAGQPDQRQSGRFLRGAGHVVAETKENAGRVFTAQGYGDIPARGREAIMSDGYRLMTFSF